ncbi:MAG: mannose-1-phosphate guanylyltransferase [Gammaproteobacteria bacterium]|nr:MAG: mannose-1-phosphate guanylyltransferase [Gammaproteobacteria bacterium]
MNVIILSAGRGERLRPLTDHSPKPLLQAGNKRLIEYTIDALVKAGLNNIVINTAYLAEQFPQKLGDGKRYNATITYSDEQAGGLETAGGIINALTLLGNEPFLVVNGDIWTDYPFEQLHNFKLAQGSLGHLVFVTNPEHNLTGDFSISSGVISTDDSNKLTYSGIAIFHPALFSDLEVQRLALKPLLLEAIAKQQLTGEHYRGEWSDIGTVERLQQLINQLER